MRFPGSTLFDLPRRIRALHGRQALRTLLIRGRKPVGVTVVAVALVQGLLALAVPWAIKGPGLSAASNALNRAVTLASARFNPFTWTLTLEDLRIRDRPPLADRDFVAVDRIIVDLSVSSLWRRAPVFDRVRLESPRVTLARTAPAVFNVSDLIIPSAGKPADPTRFALRDLTVHGGELHLADLTQDTRHTVEQIEFSLPYLANFEDEADTAVTPLLTAKVHGGWVKLGARSKPFAATRETTLHLGVQGLDLAAALAHLPGLGTWRLDRGTLDSQVELTLRAGAVPPGPAAPASAPIHPANPDPSAPSGGMVLSAKAVVDIRQLASSDPHGDHLAWAGLHLEADPLVLSLDADAPHARLEGGRLTVSDLQLGDPAEGPSMLAFKSLQLGPVSLDSRRRSVTVERVDLAGAAWLGHRDSHGTLNLSGLLDRLPHGAPAPTTPSTGTDKTGPGWSFEVSHATVAETTARWRDDAASPKVDLGLKDLKGEFHGLSNQPGSQARYELQADLAQGGRVSLDGTARPGARQAAAQLQVAGLNLAVAQPYLGQAVNLQLSSGSLNTRGRLAVDAGADLRVSYQGDADITDLYTREPDTQDDFLRWKKLTASGLDVDVAPLAPSAKDHIRIGAVAVQDLYAKVVVNPNGRINLQDVLKAPRGGAPAAPGDSTRNASAPAPGPQLQWGGLRIAGGRLNFSDQFIKPHYTANITDLSGTLSGFGPKAPPAQLRLQGRVEGDAPITIEGRVNPVSQPLFADIEAKARGIDLPTLSPYSSKYVGYAIERGKLSLEMHYRIADGKLSADNRIFLDQLTFGAPVDSPTATQLPVLFAVSLLKNGRGEIDLHLPVAGSLDDPQFSMGSVIAQALVNLLKRAVTSPFRVLSALVSGGSHGSADDIGVAQFEPGTDQISPASRGRLDKLAQALGERPTLRLDIAGHVDPVAELGPMRRAQLMARVQAERRKGQPANDDPLPPVRGDEPDYPQWLQRVYDATALPGKPRNLIGVSRKIAVADMESLLMAATVVTEDDMRQLAQARANVARHALVAGKVSSERLFIVSPVVASAPKAQADAPADQNICRSACVEFDLR